MPVFVSAAIYLCKRSNSMLASVSSIFVLLNHNAHNKYRLLSFVLSQNSF